MTRLLTPEDVKSGPSRAQREQQMRVRDLSDEETRLVLSINKLRTEETEERARIDAEIQKMRNVVAAESVTLETGLSALKTKRAELMAPIDKIVEAAEERDRQSLIREKAVAKREADVITATTEAEEKITEAMEQIADRQQEQDERETFLVEREAKEKDIAERLGKSAEELNEKWAIYHKAVVEKNRELKEREAKVAAAAAVNEVARLENEKRAADYKAKDREIADRYATLTRASQEIDERQQAVAAREAEISNKKS